jgi:hypothetical protein
MLLLALALVVLLVFHLVLLMPLALVPGLPHSFLMALVAIICILDFLVDLGHISLAEVDEVTSAAIFIKPPAWIPRSHP